MKRARARTRATIQRQDLKGRRSLFVDIDRSLFLELRAAVKEFRRRDAGPNTRQIVERALRVELEMLRHAHNDGRPFGSDR